jgi:HAD superfamily hydrolase (TIGR01459 family)
MTPVHLPPILDNVGELLSGYDVLLCDIWGVVHDGNRAFPEANATLTRFREQGGTVVLVTNAPSPAAALEHVLDSKQVVRTAWDAILSSGDLALAHIRERGYQCVHRIGPAGRDSAFFRALDLPDAPIEAADAIACTGLIDDRSEQAEVYRGRLEQAFARGLPFVCVNPDLAVHVGPDLLPCAGAIATIYEAMGGEVFWAGKPHPVAYGTARKLAEARRGSGVRTERILGIGDSIRTDLAAARNADVDALFITSGIHRDELMVGGVLERRRLAELFRREAPTAVAVASRIIW